MCGAVGCGECACAGSRRGLLEHHARMRETYHVTGWAKALSGYRLDLRAEEYRSRWDLRTDPERTAFDGSLSFVTSFSSLVIIKATTTLYYRLNKMLLCCPLLRILICCVSTLHNRQNVAL